MGKLNYINRKIDGLKLAQVVAKDLSKRLPEATGFKAARRDPDLDVDLTNKEVTDEGVEIFAPALTKSIPDEASKLDTLKLEELCLKGNKLTARSLVSLSKVVSSASATLRDLDLSNNDICIVNGEEILAWEEFLEAFSKCCRLSRIDFSGNPLGVKAFEIFSKVYVQSERLDFLEPAEKLDDSKEVLGSKDLNTRLCALDISGSSKDKPTERPSRTKASRTSISKAKAPERKQAASLKGAHFKCTRGLPSVPYLVFQNVAMTDTSALHLSRVVREHILPQNLLEYVPFTQGGAAHQRFEAYSRVQGGCRGIVYLPNTDLTGPGYRVLYFAEALRNNTNDGYREAVESSSPNGAFNNSPANDSEEDPAKMRMALAAKKAEFKSARTKLEDLAMKTDGLHSFDVWSKAFRMFVAARAVLLDKKEELVKGDIPLPPQEYQETFPPLPHGNSEELVAVPDP